MRSCGMAYVSAVAVQSADGDTAARFMAWRAAQLPAPSQRYKPETRDQTQSRACAVKMQKGACTISTSRQESQRGSTPVTGPPGEVFSLRLGVPWRSWRHTLTCAIRGLHVSGPSPLQAAAGG